ncbi:MAG: DUF1893 domain-containing protein [Alistipes sp.]|nr:DUF1893 domain-containing protein [Alistipes sp.]
MKQKLIDRLHAEGCSCVIFNNNATRIFHQRGVKDLHNLLTTEPEVLNGAMLADKVVGKGAAALMVAGGVEWVYAEVISQYALELLTKNNITTEYGGVVTNIINRTGTDICPVEKLCLRCDTIEECLQAIDGFIAKL